MQRTLGSRLIFLFTLFLYLAGVACALAAVLVHVKTVNDPLRGALIAAALYLLGCGGVLQLAVRMARPRSGSDAA